MARLRIAALSVVLLLTSVFWSVTPASAELAGPEVTYYLSLGDSLAQGVQPVGPGNENAITNEGYPDQLYYTLLKSNPSLKLVKLGCPGESTLSMHVPASALPLCQALIYQQLGVQTQLDAAVQFLQQHQGAVKYVTLDIGANDVGACLQPNGVDRVCLLRGVQQINSNLPSILKTLRDTLRQTDQKGVKVAGMTYYDPGLAFWFADQQAARDTVNGLNLVNGLEVARYIQFGFRVAPVAARFHTNNFTIPAGSTTPVNVATVCLLTWMCSPPVAPNIHAKPAGYALIADTFAQTLRW
jgi:lysophospholipase L1-like esterase